MAQTYLGNTEINSLYLGQTKINKTINPYTIQNSEVENWVVATGMANEDVRIAVDQFVSGLKTDNVWDKFVAIYPLITDNVSDAADQFSINLVNSSLYTLSYTSPGTFGYDGYTNGGSNSYASTALNPSASLYPVQGNRIHLSFYTSESFASAREGHMGAFACQIVGAGTICNGYGIFSTGSAQYFPTGIDTYYTVGAGDINNFPLDTDEQIILSATGSGWWLSTNGTNFADPDSQTYLNGDLLKSNNDINDGEINEFTNTPILLGTINSSTGPAIGFSTIKYSFFTIGDYLTSTDASNANARIQTLQQQIDAIFNTSRAV